MAARRHGGLTLTAWSPPLPMILAVCAGLSLAACAGGIEDVLEQAGGNPGGGAVVGTRAQVNDPVPAGPHLYCITNIGHTLVAYGLATGAVLAETRRVLELDPVGPWFVAGTGYYLSRVSAAGAGANALIAFDPETLAEVGRLRFPGNSNPTTLLPLPGTALAYVALRGSTFDDFASNGIAVVDVAALAQTAYLDLNDPAHYLDGEALTSTVELMWDGGCGLAGGCVYALVNNWRDAARSGALLVLEPAGEAAPVVRDVARLGLNPQGAMVLDGDGELWVVNNGGYAEFGGEDGTVQVLDTATFADGTPDNETVATLAVGGDPTAVYALDDARAWVTIYPEQAAREVALRDNALAAAAALPVLTGPIFSTTAPSPGWFAGLGGFGPARLGVLDPAAGALIAEHDLLSGNGPVSCAEFTRP